MKTAYLEITSWRGISLGASHYYGTLRCDCRSEELQKPLTAQEAKALNEQEECESYRVGDLSNRYSDAQELLAQAIRDYQTVFPEATVLYRGCASTRDPQPVLDGPQDYLDRANALVAQCEAIGWWGDPEMGHLSDLWDELSKEFGLEK